MPLQLECRQLTTSVGLRVGEGDVRSHFFFFPSRQIVEGESEGGGRASLFRAHTRPCSLHASLLLEHARAS